MDLVSWTFASPTKYDQDQPIYIDPLDSTRSLSANEVKRVVRQLVSGFKHEGLESGDTVCVLSFNDIYYTSLYLGIVGAGGCFTGANPGYTAYELSHHLRITQAKFLLSEIKTLKIAEEAARECGIPRSKIFVLNLRAEPVPEGFRSWCTLLSCGECDWVRTQDAANTTAAYVSTSGTSGLPKAAILSHSYMVSQAEVIGRIASSSSKLIAIPPFHVFTIPSQHAIPLRRGTKCCIMPRYEQESFMNAIEKFKITTTVVVPPILTSLSKSSHPKSLQSLRAIYVGGSCATDGMQQQLYEKLHPKAKILQVYGMTEAGWATTWQEKIKDQTGSVGKPLPGTRFRLVDSDGQIIRKEGVNGEIHIRAPHPMKGYLNNPKATAEAFSDDGWIRSGDVGYFKNRRWYVIDRTKDLIKVRGWQVSPAEIEAALLEHPQILDAAVIGVAARDGSSEVPQGFVVRKSGVSIEERDVKAFLAARLARYKGVEEVRFVDRIPRNPTGKILRRVLRDSGGVQIPSTDQAAAMAYSKAIRDMEKYRQGLKADGTSAVEETRIHRRRSGSLTDASTIDSTSAPASPAREKEKEKEDPVSFHRDAVKRKGDDLASWKVKRRSSKYSMANSAS